MFIYTPPKNPLNKNHPLNEESNPLETITGTNTRKQCVVGGTVDLMLAPIGVERDSGVSLTGRTPLQQDYRRQQATTGMFPRQGCSPGRARSRLSCLLADTCSRGMAYRVGGALRRCGCELWQTTQT